MTEHAMRTAAPSERLPTAAGWVALGVLTAFLAGGLARAVADRPVLAVAASIVTVGAGALALLDPYRLTTFIPATVVAGAAISTLGNGTASNVCWFGICVLAGWSALTSPMPVVAGLWGAATLTLVVERLAGSGDPGWFAWLAGTSFSVVGCLFGRRQHDLVVELRRAQAGLAQRAQAEERNRIARELHDVIAHSLTVSLMHISSARLAVRDDPGDADRVLAEAERLSRASLEEVRHTVGLLHEQGSTDPADLTVPAAPLPASTDVGALLDGFRSAGADIQATVGDLTGVPATVGLAMYRILQESLTNAAKHAAGQPVSVQLRIGDDAMRLCIDSAGRPRQGRGLGLVSMQERAKSVGGECQAGPGGRGWLVRADLPLQARARP